MESLESINLLITDNDGNEHHRTINYEIAGVIPLLKGMIQDIGKINTAIPLTLPDYTDIDDFDDVIEYVDIAFFGIDITNIQEFGFRLMGPAMIASYLGYNFDLDIDYNYSDDPKENVHIDINSDFKAVSEKISSITEMNVIVTYEYPYIKFKFPEAEDWEDITDFMVDGLCNCNISILLPKIAYKHEEISHHSRWDNPEIWVCIKTPFLNFVWTSEYVTSTHKTISADAKYPYGKPNDYKLLCTVNKDHPLYYASRDLVETLIKDQWLWKQYDNETFEGITKVLAHFKKINNFIF